MSITLEQLKTRCETNGLRAEIKDSQFLGDKNPRYLEIDIPEGRGIRTIEIGQNDDLEIITKSGFEKYKFVQGYEAIWSDQMKQIECEVHTGSSNNVIPNSAVLTRIGRAIGDNRDSEEITKEVLKNYKRIELPSIKDDSTISIGRSSLPHRVLSVYCRDIILERNNKDRASLSIQFNGLNITTHDIALEILEEVGNSVLFQLDLVTGLPLYLREQRERWSSIERRFLKITTKQIGAPNYEYDKEAMRLYWYARSAEQMPLLKYLAFYQLIEFYFPRYSEQEAQKIILNLIKDPLLPKNPERYAPKILSAIKTSRGGKSFGEERVQLEAVLTHCINIQELYEFIKEDNDRVNFFTSKEFEKLSKEKLPIKDFNGSNSTDFLKTVGRRVYDIRCRIVHAKDALEERPILPFSPESRLLTFDLEVIEFIAQKVLIASSRPFRFALSSTL